MIITKIMDVLLIVAVLLINIFSSITDSATGLPSTATTTTTTSGKKKQEIILCFDLYTARSCAELWRRRLYYSKHNFGIERNEDREKILFSRHSSLFRWTSQQFSLLPSSWQQFILYLFTSSPLSFLSIWVGVSSSCDHVAETTPRCASKNLNSS